MLVVEFFFARACVYARAAFGMQFLMVWFQENFCSTTSEILTAILSPTGFQRVPKSTKKRSQNLEPEKVILPDAFWLLFEATLVILGAISDPAGGRGGTKIHHNGTNLAKV